MDFGSLGERVYNWNILYVKFKALGKYIKERLDLRGKGDWMNY